MLKLQDVTVVYPDGTKAVDGISLTVREGERVALVGGNGAGKTSLLLAAVGVLGLSGGSIEAAGITLGKKTLGAVREAVGMVFQNPDDQLFMPYIYDDVAFGCRNGGMSGAEVERRVDETLGRLGIAGLRSRSSLKLSGGEKRMAAIATVLAMDPSVILFDEPTAFLDHRAKRTLVTALRSLGQTQVIATHDLVFADEVCNRAVVLKDGRVAADGSLILLRDKALMADCGLEAIN